LQNPDRRVRGVLRATALPLRLTHPASIALVRCDSLRLRRNRRLLRVLRLVPRTSHHKHDGPDHGHDPERGEHNSDFLFHKLTTNVITATMNIATPNITIGSVPDRHACAFSNAAIRAA
jgi:hypothetical protein